MVTSSLCKNGNCGNQSCGFGSKRKYAFGNSVDKFFVMPFTGPASVNSVGGCLNKNIYNSSVPLSRFGNTCRAENVAAFGNATIAASSQRSNKKGGPMTKT
jgi:hypothetical protein